MTENIVVRFIYMATIVFYRQWVILSNIFVVAEAQLNLAGIVVLKTKHY